MDLGITSDSVLLDLGITSDSVSAIVDFNSKLFWESRIISDEIFVNFAVKVIGSVVELPANKVECVKMV